MQRSYGTQRVGGKAVRLNYASGCVDCCQERMPMIEMFGAVTRDDGIVVSALGIFMVEQSSRLLPTIRHTIRF
jgi:hypothetical protein